MAGPRTCLMLGLPDTGKTTFLAALWHVVEANDVDGALRLQRLHGDRSHLNSLRDDWLKCQRLPRTPIASYESVSLLLEDPEGSLIGEVIVPDLSGEVFNTVWSDRTWPNALDEVIRSLSALLIFINPETLREPAWIDEAQPAVELLGEHDEGEALEPRAWEPVQVCDQVKLVDNLQLIQERREEVGRMGLALVVSAWDVVDQATPSEWVQLRVPLLWQYLQSNEDDFRVQTYGISAQGGPLTDCEKLLSITPPSHRIMVRSLSETTNDISAPVRWVLTEEEPVQNP